jgi:hypothetical protein
MEDKVNTHVSGSVVDNISRAVWIRRTGCLPCTLGSWTKQDGDTARASVTRRLLRTMVDNCNTMNISNEVAD